MKPREIALLSKKKSDERGDDEEPKMPPLDDVMREFIDAVKSNDAAAAAKAFRGAMACADDYQDDEPDEGDEQE